MTLTQKMFEALFLDDSIEKTKNIFYCGGEFVLSIAFTKEDTTMAFDAWLSDNQIIDLAEKEFGKGETGLVIDEEDYLDMSKNEILQYLDDNAKELAPHVKMWNIESVID